MEANDELKLYSVSKAAKVLAIGKDTMYRLISEGNVGYITIGKRKKIPVSELVRFQNESVKLVSSIPQKHLDTEKSINKFFNHGKVKRKSLNGSEILSTIMKDS